MPRTFTHEISSLLWVFRLLGWLPAELDSKTGKLTLELNTWRQISHFVFAQFLVFIPSCACFYLGLKAILRSTETFPFLLYNQMLCVPAAGLIGACFAAQSRQIVWFLNDMTAFQKSMIATKHFNKGMKTLATTVRVGLATSALFTFGVVIASTVLKIIPATVLTLSVTLGFLNLVFSVTWWVCIFRAVANTTELVWLNFQNDFKSNRIFDETAERMAKCLFFVSRASTVSAFAMVWTPALGFVVMLYCIFQLAGSFRNLEAVLFLAYTLSFGILNNSIICEAAHSATQKVVTTSQLIMENIKKLDKPGELYVLQKLLERIHKNPPKVSVHGFFRIGRSLYLELLPAMLSLLIVLIQLDVQVEPPKLRDFFTFDK